DSQMHLIAIRCKTTRLIGPMAKTQRTIKKIVRGTDRPELALKEGPREHHEAQTSLNKHGSVSNSKPNPRESVGRRYD
ncbi:hypothetical protein HK101_001368, partial [Irineochytrium annulatum]